MECYICTAVTINRVCDICRDKVICDNCIKNLKYKNICLNCQKYKYREDQLNILLSIESKISSLLDLNKKTE